MFGCDLNWWLRLSFSNGLTRIIFGIQSLLDCEMTKTRRAWSRSRPVSHELTQRCGWSKRPTRLPDACSLGRKKAKNTKNGSATVYKVQDIEAGRKAPRTAPYS